MSRVEQIGAATLYLGDCREILPTLGKVDAVVTDPPYGIGFKGDTRSTKSNDQYAGGSYHRSHDLITGDDRPFNPTKILVGRRNILWGANNYAEHLRSNAGWLIWYKAGGITGFQMSECELAYTNFLGSNKYIDHLWHGFKRASENGQAVLHPTQKPVAVMEWCIGFTKGVVLDPYMGSGTTGVACANLGRRFIGIEIEPKYFDIACRRIEEAYKQPRLFAEPQAKPTQEALL